MRLPRFLLNNTLRYECTRRLNIMLNKQAVGRADAAHCPGLFPFRNCEFWLLCHSYYESFEMIKEINKKYV